MGEKIHSSSSCNCIGESSQACFRGCCAKPSFLSLPNDSSQAHNHSPKSNTPSSTITTNNTASSNQHNFTVATLSSLQPNTTHFTNHESLPPLNISYSYFIKSFPQFSNTTQQADQIRSREYYHLALSNHVCLDYVGLGLFSSYSSKPHQNPNNTNNACSSSSSSSSSNYPSFFDLRYKAANLNSLLIRGSQESFSKLEVMLRKRIMDFMNISEEDYTMVLTSNQSSAFKILADSYPFQSHRNLLTVYDHKSEALEIMTSSSKRRGARVFSAEFSWPTMRLQSRKLRKVIRANCNNNNNNNNNNKGLFVFPLQSRMSGSRYSYQWLSFARENGWHVLLDACALGPKDMETLGLSLFKPDFLICSFYKVFGQNPSGFGCLFVKKSSSQTLLTDSNTRVGIVSLAPPSIVDQKSMLEECCSEIVELEVSTRSTEMDNINIECLSGLDHADSLGLIMISCRSRCLINWLVNALNRLQHPAYSENGNPLVRIYGPNIGFDRGPSLAFNVFDWKGEKVDPTLVQKLADRNNISISYGFLDNISYVDKSEEERERRVETVIISDLDNNNNNKYQSGICAITATLGFVTNFEDIYRLWAFVAKFLDADFVEKERWRYVALNQTTVEV